MSEISGVSQALVLPGFLCFAFWPQDEISPHALVHFIRKHRSHRTTGLSLRQGMADRFKATGSAEQQGDMSSDGLQVRGSTSSAPLGCGPAQHSSVTAEASRVSIRVTLGLGRAQVQNEWLR